MARVDWAGVASSRFGATAVALRASLRYAALEALAYWIGRRCSVGHATGQHTGDRMNSALTGSDRAAMASTAARLKRERSADVLSELEGTAQVPVPPGIRAGRLRRQSLYSVVVSQT